MQAVILIAMIAAVLAPAPAAAYAATPGQLRAACAAPPGESPRLSGIDVEAVAGEPGDLPYLLITDRLTGASMRAYHDAVAERAARSRAACLGIQLRLLDGELGGARAFRAWDAAVFTATPTYTAPAGGAVTRWHVEVGADGTLTPAGQRAVVLTLPHEQVHAFQGRAEASTPRWFGEGHAEWVGRKVSQAIASDIAAEKERDFAAQLATSTTPVNLPSWGGVQPKREAFIRQVTPAERRQMLADPNFWPSFENRSFEFGPGDLISDESNVGARYEASWRLFRDLAAAHGQERVRDWANAVTAAPGRIDQAAVVEKARAMFGEDLTARLK